MRLFTIGDGFSQGFMSGAAARTDLCYSTLIARALGLVPGGSRDERVDYYYPLWPKDGLPVNLEAVMRRLNQRYGSDLRGLDWESVRQTIDEVIKESKDFYEKGGGRADQKYVGNVPYFHNVSTWAFNAADAWLVTPQLCLNEIRKSGAAAAFYRTALKVLSPNLEQNHSQLDWLQYHARNEGIENLILWLGMNNVLGTILSFQVNQTADDANKRPHHMSHEERSAMGWNLWHPGDFSAEYQALLDKIDFIMTSYNTARDWKVFIGTIPLITIAPLIKGVGPKMNIRRRGIYYQYYTYMPFEEDFARKTGVYLACDDALHIDDSILEYNRIISRIAGQKNDRHRKRSRKIPYHIVDICEMLNRMAWRRNDGMPTYPFPGYFKFINPPVDTRYYHADALGRIRQGGLFSLDGVYPSAVAQGLIAHEFIKVMKEARVPFKKSLNWEKIFAADTLYQDPITLMQEIYRQEKLALFIIKQLQSLA